MKRTVSIFFAALGLAALGAPACGGDDSSGGATPTTGRTCTDVQPTFASISEKILQVKDTCGGSNCHTDLPTTGPKATLKMLGVDATTLHASLLDKTDRLDGSVRVVPGDPANSFLVAKLKGDFSAFPCAAVADPSKAGHCGDKMPNKPNPALCANEIAAIEKWIADGAKP